MLAIKLTHKVKGSWMVALFSMLLSCMAAHTEEVAIDETDYSDSSQEDPWEGVNRVTFTFNDTLDTYILKPVTKAYHWVTPDPVEDGVHNFFNNMGDAGNLVNSTLQGKFHQAASDTSRLLLNSTIGVFGIFDVATKMGLRRSEEDFGQTLGVWGVDTGPYLVLPFLGPSTVRNAFGRVPDSFVKVYPYLDNISLRNQLFGAGVIDERNTLLGAEKLMRGDKYTFIRNAYLQNNNYKANDGAVIEDDF